MYTYIKHLHIYIFVCVYAYVSPEWDAGRGSQLIYIL